MDVICDQNKWLSHLTNSEKHQCFTSTICQIGQKLAQQTIRQIFNTRRLATANKLWISIRVTNFFGQVHYRNGWPCKKFPLILFDHHAEFGCCLPFQAGVHRKSKNVFGVLGPFPWDRIVPCSSRNTPLPSLITVTDIDNTELWWIWRLVIWVKLKPNCQV